MKRAIKEIYRWVLIHERPLHRTDKLGCSRTLVSHPHLYMDEADDHGMIIAYCILGDKLVEETMEERVFKELKRSSAPQVKQTPKPKQRKKKL